MEDRKAIIHCENCRFACASAKHGTFDVTVPLTDVKARRDYVACLRCEVDASGHRIAVKRFQDSEGATVSPSPESRNRIDKLLAEIARKKICGNATICPTEVVNAVHGRGDPRPLR